MRRAFLIVLFVLFHLSLSAKDVLVFGNPRSENKHAFKENQTISFIGGMGESARKMLPLTDSEWQGGTMSFQMKVDAEKQNYFTVRCWGNEADETVVMLL